MANTFIAGTYVAITQVPDGVERLQSSYGYIKGVDPEDSNYYQIILDHPAIMQSSGSGQAYCDIITVHNAYIKSFAKSSLPATDAGVSTKINNPVQHVTTVSHHIASNSEVAKVDPKASKVR